MSQHTTGILSLVIVLSGFFLAGYITHTPTSEAKPSPNQQQKHEEVPEFCIQVITPAMDPNTGEVVEFPTPCDVPEGWEPVSPENIDLSLQVI